MTGKNWMQRIRPIVIFLWLTAGMAWAAQAVVPGDVAPDFTLQDLSGASYTLSNLTGQVVLLAFVGWG